MSEPEAPRRKKRRRRKKPAGDGADASPAGAGEMVPVQGTDGNITMMSKAEADAKAPPKKKQADGAPTGGGSRRKIVWRESRPPFSDEDWVNTYADAITLLMAFFVVLYSISEPKKDMYDAMKTGLLEEFGQPDAKAEFESPAVQLQETVEAQNMEEFVTVEEERKGIRIEVGGDIFFKPNSTRLRRASVPVLEGIVDAANHPAYDTHYVRVEGHTDDKPLPEKFKQRRLTKWELSAMQATNVARYLISKGVERGRVNASAFADTDPKIPSRDLVSGNFIRENLQKNRRIVVWIERRF